MPYVILSDCLQGNSIGGVWAKERIYPGLRSNNLLGTFELPSYPVHKELGVKPGEHIPGEVRREEIHLITGQQQMPELTDCVVLR